MENTKVYNLHTAEAHYDNLKYKLSSEKHLRAFTLIRLYMNACSRAEFR